MYIHTNILIFVTFTILFFIIAIKTYFDKIENFTSNFVYVHNGIARAGKYGKTCIRCNNACPDANRYLSQCGGVSSGTCADCTDENKVSIVGGIGEESCVAKEGYYTEMNGIATECPINTYKNAIGDYECSDCPSYTSSVIGSTSIADCINCPIGHGRTDGDQRCLACLPGQDSLEGGACTPCATGTFSWNGGRCVLPESSATACGWADRVWYPLNRGNCVNSDGGSGRCDSAASYGQGEAEAAWGIYHHWTGRSFQGDCCVGGGGHYPNAVAAYCSNFKRSGPAGM